MVDPGDGSALYGAPVIVRHLFARYGAGKAPARLLVPPHVTPLAAATSWLRGRWLGRYARPSRKPDRPLELWSFEASPYCRIAREALTSLEIPYLLHNVGKRSPSRPAFVARSGKMQVPYLVDPNTGQSMFESADIVVRSPRVGVELVLGVEGVRSDHAKVDVVALVERVGTDRAHERGACLLARLPAERLSRERIA